MKLLFGSEDWVQKAERWCTSTCQLNPYWAMSREVMWLCIQCERWYHFECCATKPRVGVGFATLYDYLSLPLLKGGSLGPFGTAPVVRAAAHLVITKKNNGGDGRVLLEMELGADLAEVLPGMDTDAKGFLHSQIGCPTCHMG